MSALPPIATLIRPRASQRIGPPTEANSAGHALASEGTGRRSNERLFAFVRARTDAIIGGLPIHRGPRNFLDLVGYVVIDGQLLDTRWKRIWNCLVCHFKISPFDELVLNRGGPT